MFNNTREEQLTKKARDIALKLSYENRLQRELVTKFRKIVKEIANFLNMTGVLIDVKLFEDDLRIIFLNHYVRVLNKFGRLMSQDINKKFKGTVPKVFQDDVVSTLEPTIDSKVNTQVKLILNTLSKGAQKLLTDAQQEKSLDFQDLDIKFIDEFRKSLLNLTVSRAGIIATTETQSMAELAKLTEAIALAESTLEVNGTPFANNTVKIWETVLDERTRSHHAVADGQRRLVDSPFEVNGEFLNQPGDASLGASLDNIINCRCSSSFVIAPPNRI